MVVGLLKVEMFMPEATSLKAKRQVVKSVIGRVESKFRVSIAEVDHQDLWQRSAIAVAYVSETGDQVRRALQNVKRFIESLHKADILKEDLYIFSPEREN